MTRTLRLGSKLKGEKRKELKTRTFQPLPGEQNLKTRTLPTSSRETKFKDPNTSNLFQGNKNEAVPRVDISCQGVEGIYETSE